MKGIWGPESTTTATTVTTTATGTISAHTRAWAIPHLRQGRPEPGARISPRVASASPVSWTAGSHMAAYRTWYSQPEGALPQAWSTARST